MWTEIYRCHACSGHETEDGNGRAGVIDLPAGELLFRQGDHGDEAYAVLQGSCVTDPIPSRAAGAAGGASAAVLGALAQPGHRRSRERLHTSMNYQARVASASKLLGGARAQVSTIAPLN
eukprot:COSAG01_NODE_2290_length_7984_cov_10.803424_9_plen_120_part_00